MNIDEEIEYHQKKAVKYLEEVALHAKAIESCERDAAAHRAEANRLMRQRDEAKP